MVQLTEALKREYEAKFAAVKITPSKQSALSAAVKVILNGRSRYEDVEKETGVPWYVVGVIHMRESSCDFRTYLGNGDPLNRVSTHVPAGRGPFATWAEGAIDALRLQRLHLVNPWDLATILFNLEAYNGWGYRNKGVPSPYLWSFTDQYSSGKYISDGKFSSSAVDTQPGTAAMLWQMILLNIIPDLAKKVISMATDTITPAPAAPVKPAANTSTGVTVNPAQNLATHIITAVGVLFAATGLTQIHSMYDAITNSSLIGGMVVSALAMLISHFNVNGANTNTIDMIDKVLVALTPTAAQTLISTGTDAQPTAAS